MDVGDSVLVGVIVAVGEGVSVGVVVGVGVSVMTDSSASQENIPSRVLPLYAVS